MVATENSDARFKILVHEDPDDDTLILYVDYRNVHVRLLWRDGEREDVISLLSQGHWFIERGHMEHEIQKNAAQIDADLGSLFPEEAEMPEEEVEDGE